MSSCTIRQACNEMGVHIARGMPACDHIRMFLSIPPKLALPDVMQRIKGCSFRRIQMEYTDLRKRCWGKCFGRGIFFDNLGQCDRQYHPAIPGITFRQMMPLAYAAIVHSVRAEGVIKQCENIRRKTLRHRRLHHRRLAA